MNDTTTFSGLRFGIQRGDEYHWLSEERTLSADRRYSFSEEIVVRGGENLVVAFDGVTANDACEVETHGYSIFEGE